MQITKDKLNIAVIGGGGREHAIIRRLAQSRRAGKIYALPGNGGISREHAGSDSCPVTCTGIAATDLEKIVDFVLNNEIDFAAVIPDDTLSVYLIIYCTHRFPVQLRLSCIKPDWRLDAKLYSIGVPAILNLALPSVLVSFLNSLLAAYSQGYVVILGIYYKLQTFLYLPAGGIVQGMRPLISYNYGAGEHGRVKKIYNLAMGMNAAIMAAGTIICLVGSPALIGMFTTNADTIAAGQVALRIISAGFLVSTLSVTASGSLEALGKGTQSLIISLCRYIIIMIPAAWILCRLFGPVGVWHAFWVTELLSALAAALVYKRTVKLNV